MEPDPKIENVFVISKLQVESQDEGGASKGTRISPADGNRTSQMSGAKKFAHTRNSNLSIEGRGEVERFRLRRSGNR